MAHGALMRHGGLSQNPSASNAEAFAMCTVSHVLPQRSETAERAQKGTDGHDALTALINHHACTNERGKAMIAKFPLTEVMRGVGLARAEAAYAVNVKKRTVRFIGVDIGRNYGPLDDYEVPTSLDVEGFKDGQRWIRDWKFGTHSSLWQLYIQGMCAAYPSASKPSVEPEVNAGFVYIDGDVGGAKWEDEPHILFLADLDERADELVKAFDRVSEIHAMLEKNIVPRLAEGTWCKYCPAMPACPAKWTLAKAMIDELSVSNMLTAMTDAQVGKVYVKYQECKRILEKLGDDLKLRVGEGAIPLTSGKVVKLSKTKGWAYFDRAKTQSLLETKGATQNEIAGAMVTRADSYSLKEMKR